MSASEISENLKDVQSKLDEALEQAGRSPDDCALVAVSKTKPTDLIRKAISLGQCIFGENKVQEAEDKWPDIQSEFPDVELRLIGPLQSNKVRKAIQLFDVIETLDRPKLARAIARISTEEGRNPRLYVQVNTGEEAQKAGVYPSDLPKFLQLCRKELGLEIEGLMCIPPVDEESALHFALLEKLARENAVPKLSMGMSGDYEAAARLGATSVRVGTAIFGVRCSAHT